LAFKQDVEIWHNKIRVDNPLLCSDDGPVHLLRAWYNQFYVDAADVPQEQKKLREWEWDRDGSRVARQQDSDSRSSIEK